MSYIRDFTVISNTNCTADMLLRTQNQHIYNLIKIYLEGSTSVVKQLPEHSWPELSTWITSHSLCSSMAGPNLAVYCPAPTHIDYNTVYGMDLSAGIWKCYISVEMFCTNTVAMNCVSHSISIMVYIIEISLFILVNVTMIIIYIYIYIYLLAVTKYCALIAL